MFEFFVALFGSAFCGGRSLLNKQTVNANNRKIENRSLMFDYIFADKHIENSVSERMKTDKKYVLQTIADDLRSVYGKTWQEHFQYQYCDETDIRNPWGVAYHIYMSRYGKVPDGVRDYSIAYMPEETRANIVRMCAIIERNIQTSHPEQTYRMYIVPLYNQHHPNTQCIKWEHDISLPTTHLPLSTDEEVESYKSKGRSIDRRL